jgi:uroporphyrinogen decarboxylase
MNKPRERFIQALERQPISGRVPHFELAFFLTMQAFGRVHPIHRDYSQWFQMEERERQLHRVDMAEIYIATAERFEHDAILILANPNNSAEADRVAEIIREKTGDRYFLMCHGDATYSIPDGSSMQEFCYRISDDPQGLKNEADAKVDEAIRAAEKLKQSGCMDGFALCSDYCFNNGPFLSPRLFSKFIAPYLTRLIQAYREMGFYVIKHTDGNIMPILDQLAAAGPHALHSLDPQGCVDIAVVKSLVGDKLCLIGNVDCGLLDNGTDEQVVESVRYALQNGMPGYGYVFSTSNCVYTGMRLERYELMLDIWKREGNYPVIQRS